MLEHKGRGKLRGGSRLLARQTFLLGVASATLTLRLHGSLGRREPPQPFPPSCGH